MAASYKLRNQVVAEILATYAGGVADEFTWISQKRHNGPNDEYIEFIAPMPNAPNGAQNVGWNVTIILKLINYPGHDAGVELSIRVIYNDQKVIATEQLVDPDGITRMNKRVAGLVAGFATNRVAPDEEA
jgi:hypothetical protein